MKKGIFIGVLFSLLFTTFILSESVPAEDSIKFLDAAFGKRMCDGWNNSPLPKKLASKSAGGNGWIDEKNKYTGKVEQKEIVVSRRDCSGWEKIQLTIENKNGLATCTYGGALDVDYDNAAWAFSPKTIHWYRFATKWSAMDMPAIMPGFRGPIPSARKNLQNFGHFWKMAGSLAKTLNADYKEGCSGLSSSDASKIEGYIKKIK